MFGHFTTLCMKGLRRYRRIKMSDVEMDDLVDTKVCFKCGVEKTGEQLDQVGALWKEISRHVHPLHTLISNQEDQMATFIHTSCITELRKLS